MAQAGQAQAEADLLALARMARLLFDSHGVAALSKAAKDTRLRNDESLRAACAGFAALAGAIGVGDGGGEEAAMVVETEAEAAQSLCALSLHDTNNHNASVHAVPDPVLLRVFEHLAGPSNAARRDLCAALATCHRFRSLCLHDNLWAPTLQALYRAWHGKGQIEAHFATLGRVLHPDGPPPLPVSCPPGGSKSRAVLAYRGRCVAGAGVLLVGPRWPERYWINIEVHDRRDGLVLFSGVGPMGCQQWTNANEHRTILRLAAAGTTVTAQPFAARERGPYQNVREYFQRAHLPNSPAQVCVRVVAIDRRTGREALLYESGRYTDRHCQDAAEGWPVPGGSFAVTDHADTYLAPTTGCGGGGGGGEKGALRALFDFTCVPVDAVATGAGEEGQGQEAPPPAVPPPAERRYQVHTGPIRPPINTIAHTGIVGLVFLAKAHEVGLLLGTVAWT